MRMTLVSPFFVDVPLATRIKMKTPIRTISTRYAQENTHGVLPAQETPSFLPRTPDILTQEARSHTRYDKWLRHLNLHVRNVDPALGPNLPMRPRNLFQYRRVLAICQPLIHEFVTLTTNNSVSNFPWVSRMAFHANETPFEHWARGRGKSTAKTNSGCRRRSVSLRRSPEACR